MEVQKTVQVPKEVISYETKEVPKDVYYPVTTKETKTVKTPKLEFVKEDVQSTTKDLFKARAYAD